MSRTRRQRGFTLIELSITLAIVTIMLPLVTQFLERHSEEHGAEPNARVQLTADIQATFTAMERDAAMALGAPRELGAAKVGPELFVLDLGATSAESPGLPESARFVVYRNAPDAEAIERYVADASGKILTSRRITFRPCAMHADTIKPGLVLVEVSCHRGLNYTTLKHHGRKILALGLTHEDIEAEEPEAPAEDTDEDADSEDSETTRESA